MGSLKLNWNSERFHYCASDRHDLGVMLGSEAEGGRMRNSEGGLCLWSVEEGKDL